MCKLPKRGSELPRTRLHSAEELDPDAVAKYLAGKVLSSLLPPHLSPRLKMSRSSPRRTITFPAKGGASDRGGGKGIKVRSFNTRTKNLHLAMGLSTAKNKPRVTERKPLDAGRTIRSLVKADLEALVDFWMDLPVGIDSDRTAINYLREFYRFLKWCGGQETWGFTMPKGSDELFLFSIQKIKKAAKYDSDLLRCLLSSGTEKCKLFQLLGLNGGLYQQDISDLKQGDLIVHNGKPCLWWLRSKEELVEGEDSTFRILTPLWPESYDLLLKFRARRIIRTTGCS